MLIPDNIQGKIQFVIVYPCNATSQNLAKKFTMKWFAYLFEELNCNNVFPVSSHNYCMHE